MYGPTVSVAMSQFAYSQCVASFREIIDKPMTPPSLRGSDMSIHLRLLNHISFLRSTPLFPTVSLS